MSIKLERTKTVQRRETYLCNGAMVWVNLKVVTLREIGLEQKYKHFMSLLTCEILRRLTLLSSAVQA